MTEAELQNKVADYLRLQYPDVLFHSADEGRAVGFENAKALIDRYLGGANGTIPR